MPRKYVPYHLRTGVIYKITYLITGKAYIGQSTQIQQRIKQHFNWKDGKSYIDRAIRLHGKENFKVEILCSAINLDYLDELEVLLIEFHKTHVSQGGYNLHLGGQANRKVSVETRQKQRVGMTGKPAWNKGKKATDEHRKNLSESHKGKVSSFKGKKHTLETRKHISDLQKGKERPNKQKSVLATHIITGEIRKYKSLIDAKKEGFKDSNISKVCNGLRYSHRSYTWRYV